MANTAAVDASVALITARAARAHDADLPLLEAALGARGLRAEILDWDDASVDWSQFALVLLRSTWDYSGRLGEFLSWLGRAELVTKIFNPPDVIRWSLDKHYLAELHRSGVRIVPTGYAECGEEPDQALSGFLKDHSATELVLKPAVGSGARDAQRYARSATGPMSAHMARLLAEGRSVMVQPYLEGVDEQGETALIYIDGEFSHAIGKGAVLRRGAEPTQALFAPEEVIARTAAPDELELGARVLGQLPFGNLLYARVDLLRDASGSPCVLELELAEPSLYLGYSPHAPARLAEAVSVRV